VCRGLLGVGTRAENERINPQRGVQALIAANNIENRTQHEAKKLLKYF